MNTIIWLAQVEELISIRPKDPADRRVTVTSSQQPPLFWLTILLMLGLRRIHVRWPNDLTKTMLLLRSIFFTFLLPGTVTVLLPYWLTTSRGALPSNYQAIHYFGFPLIVIGATGLLSCIWEFFSRGRGTLAPIDPPRHLVVRGPYRYVRNPMYVSVVTILIGEAIAFIAVPILIEAGVFIVLANLFVQFYEEPALRQQFGSSYERYSQAVSRWVPHSRSRST